MAQSFPDPRYHPLLMFKSRQKFPAYFGMRAFCSVTRFFCLIFAVEVVCLRGREPLALIGVR